MNIFEFESIRLNRSTADFSLFTKSGGQTGCTIRGATDWGDATRQMLQEIVDNRHDRFGDLVSFVPDITHHNGNPTLVARKNGNKYEIENIS